MKPSAAQIVEALRNYTSVNAPTYVRVDGGPLAIVEAVNMEMAILPAPAGDGRAIVFYATQKYRAEPR